MTGHRAVLILEFESEEEARAAYEALSVDEDDYMALSINGAVVECRAKGRNTLSLLYTIDDLLASLDLHMKTLRSTEVDG